MAGLTSLKIFLRPDEKKTKRKLSRKVRRRNKVYQGLSRTPLKSKGDWKKA